MNMNVEKTYDGFSFSVTDSQKEFVQKLVKLTHEEMGLTETPATQYPPVAPLSYWAENASAEAMDAAIYAVRLFYKASHLAGNKIYTIRFVRCLTGMGLKESKDFVDYALNDPAGAPKPSWFKSMLVPYYNTK